MGARNRRKRAIARDVQAAVNAAQQRFGDDTPLMRERAVKAAESAVRRPDGMPARWRGTPDHVWERMARGHSYIKGDRAPRIALSRSERRMNADARRAQASERESYAVKVTEYGVKRTVGRTTGRVVASERVSRETRRIASKRVRDGESLTPRSESAVEHNAAIVSGRVFVRGKQWRAVRTSQVSD